MIKFSLAFLREKKKGIHCLRAQTFVVPRPIPSYTNYSASSPHSSLKAQPAHSVFIHEMLQERGHHIWAAKIRWPLDGSKDSSSLSSHLVVTQMSAAQTW